MGQNREELQALFKAMVPNVYHQAPPNVQMEYPCIRYERDDIQVNHADNVPYKRKNRWRVTVIDADPDSDIPDKVAELPLCSFDRHYTAEGLNHDVFTLYF